MHTTVTHTFFHDQSTSNSSSFKYSLEVLEDGWSASLFLPLSLFLSPGILIIPPDSPPHRVGGFFPSDKVSRSFYKLIRVCSLWSRQLWTRRIDLAGESAAPDHDFKRNPMVLWRHRARPGTIPTLPLQHDGSNLQVEGRGRTGSSCTRPGFWSRWFWGAVDSA